MNYEINWAMLQREKQFAQIKKLIRKVIFFVAIAIGMFAVMAIGGLTFPY